MSSPIKIYKKTLQAAKWFIQWQANKWDNLYIRDVSRRPYVIGYCPVCECQRFLTYVGQTKDEFVFECVTCQDFEKKGGIKI